MSATHARSGSGTVGRALSRLGAIGSTWWLSVVLGRKGCLCPALIPCKRISLATRFSLQGMFRRFHWRVMRRLWKSLNHYAPPCSNSLFTHNTRTLLRCNFSVNWINHLQTMGKNEIGAGGRTRTDTTFYGPRILSPVRLPFRHTGNTENQLLMHRFSFQLDLGKVHWYACHCKTTQASSG